MILAKLQSFYCVQILLSFIRDSTENVNKVLVRLVRKRATWVIVSSMIYFSCFIPCIASCIVNFSSELGLADIFSWTSYTNIVFSNTGTWMTMSCILHLFLLLIIVLVTLALYDLLNLKHCLRQGVEVTTTNYINFCFNCSNLDRLKVMRKMRSSLYSMSLNWLIPCVVNVKFLWVLFHYKYVQSFWYYIIVDLARFIFAHWDWFNLVYFNFLILPSTTSNMVNHVRVGAFCFAFWAFEDQLIQNLPHNSMNVHNVRRVCTFWTGPSLLTGDGWVDAIMTEEPFALRAFFGLVHNVIAEPANEMINDIW